MAVFTKSLKSLGLKLNIHGQFEDVHGNIFADVKSLRKTKAHKISLSVADEFFSIHKVYLDEACSQKQSLPETLLREIEKDEPLKIKDVFYDYRIIESSLPSHQAYEFIWVKRAKLKAYLQMLKSARLRLSHLSPSGFLHMNLLPWREEARQKILCKQLLRLFLLPALILVLLLSLYFVLLQKNNLMAEQVSLHYNKNLANQIGQRQTLKSFEPAFALMNQLPQGVNLNELEFAHNTWFVSGDMLGIQSLSALNDKLVQMGWLDLNASVDVHEQDQEYLWQFKKLERHS